MTQRSDLGKQQAYSIIDSPINAAHSLVEHFIKPKSTKESRAIVDATVAGGAAYTQPLHSWLTWPFYVWTRTREEPINKLVSDLNSCRPVEDRRLALQYLLDFMDEGTWYEGSSNTLIMYELLKLLPQYKKTDPEPSKTFTWQAMQALYTRFKERAEIVIAAAKEDKPEVVKLQQEDELKQIPSNRVLKQMLFAQATKPVEKMVIDIPLPDKATREDYKKELLDRLQHPEKYTVAAMKAAEAAERKAAAPPPQAQPIEEESVETEMAAPPTPPPPPPLSPRIRR